MTEASSSSSESNKRKAEDEMRDPKRTKDDKGKGKDKTD
jgi:hypothetical protein